jgi:hypothetical protein
MNSCRACCVLWEEDCYPAVALLQGCQLLPPSDSSSAHEAAKDTEKACIVQSIARAAGPHRAAVMSLSI